MANMAKNNSKKKGTPCFVTETENLIYQEFPEIGKTICTLFVDPMIFVDVINKVVENESCFKIPDRIKLFPPHKIGVTYTGVSKVNTAEGDVYDPQVGRDIAKSKAIAKFQKAMRGNLKYLLEELNRATASMEHYMDVHNINYAGVISVDKIKATKYKDAYPEPDVRG